MRDNSLEISCDQNTFFESKFMIAALKQAEIAASIGEIPVGAVVTYDGKIISKAHNLSENEKSPIKHAEILALEEAAKKLKTKFLLDCDLFVTLEPCPLCAAAISMFRVRRLFYGAKDIKFGAVESVTCFFKSQNCFHQPEVYSGIYENDASIILKDFFKKIRHSNKTGEKTCYF